MSAGVAIWRRLRADRAAMAGGLVAAGLLLAALLAPWLAPYAPNAVTDPVGLAHRAPYAAHLLGTDAFGRDVWSRLLFGARVSLAVGLASSALAVAIGGAVGLAAGLATPGVDGLIMRGVDVLLALPRLFLLMAAFALWDAVPLWGMVALIAGTGWFATCRLVRAHARQLRDAEFVVASRALGGGRRAVLRHLLPHVAATAIVSATLDIGNIILIEAGLSYLGLGLRPPTSTWGNMILEGKTAMFAAPWVVLAPGGALVVTVIAFNLLGDGVRDALNPRLQ